MRIALCDSLLITPRAFDEWDTYVKRLYSEHPICKLANYTGCHISSWQHRFAEQYVFLDYCKEEAEYVHMSRWSCNVRMTTAEAIAFVAERNALPANERQFMKPKANERRYTYCCGRMW
jgi:hypothetical protein